MIGLLAEIRIAIYLTLYGAFLFVLYEIADTFLPTKNKYFYILKEIVLLCLMLLLTFKFTSSLHQGYIPMYFILFLGIGIMLYFFFLQEHFQKVLKALKKSLNVFYTKILCLSPRLKAFFYQYTIERAKKIRKKSS